jgi:CRISPR-associated protein Cas1
MVMEKTVFSTAILRKCTDNNIPFTITLNTGYYITTIKPDSKKYYDIQFEHGRKYSTLTETEIFCIAKEFAAGKMKGYISLFKQKYMKGQNLFINELEEVIDQIYQAGDIHNLRGLEGATARKIYQRLNSIIEHDIFHIKKRDREHPDRINSLLNFGYYLLFSRINATVRGVGLNPYLGFLHSPMDNYESLVCDIEELFRARIDRFIIRLINLKVITKDDFEETPKGLYLKREGVKKFLTQFEAEMDRKGANISLSLKESIYLQTVIIKKWAIENASLPLCNWAA